VVVQGTCGWSWIPNALAARQTAPLEVAWAIDVSNKLLPAGNVQILDQDIVVEAGDFIQRAADLKRLVINVVDGVPVTLGDVAQIRDGPAEVDSYTWIGFGPASNQLKDYPDVYPAVAISIAKKKGANAVWVAKEIEDYFRQAKARNLSPGGQLSNYPKLRPNGQCQDQ
jgi:multidrug efflux pump subunit AcrB